MASDVKLLLVGATGLVGRHVLSLALGDPRVGTVVAPTRRLVPAYPKLSNPQIDFDNLPMDAGWWQTDAVVCTLGTTMRTAGSQEAFRRVDYDYPMAVARLARENGTRTYVLNSAIGADTASRFFYNRVKGELERDLAGVGFDSLTHVRPGVIRGHRKGFRLGEHAMVVGLTLMGPLVPQRWRLNPAQRIAQALLESAINPTPGVHVVTSERLT